MTEDNAGKIQNPRIVKLLQDHKEVLLKFQQGMPERVNGIKNEIERHTKIVEILERMLVREGEMSVSIDESVADINSKI